mmetsp:Transcript_23550/g.37420  ORF Transcript_23550/g.37420 Transcript_23550/m.37420 type:complete len:287 (+) Transcript_23550:47-907(+)|eukprot:CAMPEP_0197046524 /NCGR_PEP_ID=MMETSP1384-20130603/22227_1 /TAXON_ID=29189 /ORGANISM="Ammonia sp." /LENGTH=286 /DNA_ID=CAMNT_0042478341 /DNA_START=44 /DNA_END=904 /DNA_ORIENTATION=-
MATRFICLIVRFSCLLSVIASNNDNTCEWQVDVDNDTLTLNLQRLQTLSQPIRCALDSYSSSFSIAADWELVYTPCRNGVNCSISKDEFNATMVSQLTTNKSLPSCAAYLGVWDSGKTQPIYVENEAQQKEQYVFEYKNGYKQKSGNCTAGRYLNVTYICDESIDTINEQNISCRELPYNVDNDGVCKYEMMIPTKLACLSASHHDDGGETEAMRATIWLAIIFGTVFVCYCVVGYTMNATRHHQWLDCMGNIPNANLWCCCCYKGKEYITIQDTGGLINDERDVF